MAAPVAPKCFPKLFVRGETQNRLRQFGWISRLDANSRPRLLKNLARLTFDPENHRTSARHELQHLAGNDGLEYFVLLEQNQASVRGANIGRYPLPRLLIHETQVGKAARPHQGNQLLLFRAFPHQQEQDLGRRILQLRCGLDQSLQTVSVAHGADVGDDKFSVRAQFSSQVALRPRTEQLGLNSVLDHRNLFRRDLPVLHQIILERGSHDDDVVGVPVKKSSNPRQYAIHQRICASHAHCRQRFRPQIANLEDETRPLAPRQPPPRQADQQLRRTGNHNVRALREQSGNSGREAKRAVVQHALVSLAIGKRQQPGANDVHPTRSSPARRGGGICGDIRLALHPSDDWEIRSAP